MDAAHLRIDPAILYFGTPVALLSTVGVDGRVNLAPMSSLFWLGSTAVLGMGSRSQTAANLRDTGEVVINLPSADQVDAVDRLALTTGRDPVPADKAAVGYRHVADRFAHAGLTPHACETVAPPRALECPVALEGRVIAAHPLEEGGAATYEVRVTRVHVHRAVLGERTDRIDPDRWRPLIMVFQRFYGLTAEVHPSRLATIDEEWYR